MVRIGSSLGTTGNKLQPGQSVTANKEKKASGSTDAVAYSLAGGITGATLGGLLLPIDGGATLLTSILGGWFLGSGNGLLLSALPSGKTKNKAESNLSREQQIDALGKYLLSNPTATQKDVIDHAKTLRIKCDGQMLSELILKYCSQASQKPEAA